MKHFTWGWLSNPIVLVQFVFRDRIPVFLTKLTNQIFFEFFSNYFYYFMTLFVICPLFFFYLPPHWFKISHIFVKPCQLGKLGGAVVVTCLFFVFVFVCFLFPFFNTLLLLLLLLLCFLVFVWVCVFV